MAQCIKCGKNTLVRGHVKLADAAICTPCFKSLGFKLTDTAGAAAYSYEDIKDGKDAYYKKRIDVLADLYDQAQNEEHDFKFARYGEFRDLDATEEEMEMFAQSINNNTRAIEKLERSVEKWLKDQ